VASIRVRRFNSVWTWPATGLLSKIYCQVLVSFFKDGIVGYSSKRHTDLGLTPQIRTHDTPDFTQSGLGG
jgi:hypothetical protein